MSAAPAIVPALKYCGSTEKVPLIIVGCCRLIFHIRNSDGETRVYVMYGMYLHRKGSVIRDPGHRCAPTSSSPCVVPLERDVGHQPSEL